MLLPAGAVLRSWLVASCLAGAVLNVCAPGVCAPGAAGESRRAVVVGFERFYTSGDADLAAGGRLLLGELNCVACHAADAGLLHHLPPKEGPVLDEVGSRVRPEYLRAFIADPSGAKPGATMPDMFAGLSPAEKAKRVEALVHFLGSTGRILESPPHRRAVSRGERLFHQLGCVACHNASADDFKQLPTSAPLSNLSQKYSIPGLAKFLADPLAVRPAGRMPHLNLSAEEAREIASYLLRDLDVPPTLTYRYYEGVWEKLPDFSQLSPQETGGAAGFDVGISPRENEFALVFEGYLQVERAGRYTFHLGSDDGSRLLIDGQQVAINDGVHPLEFTSGSAQLAAGAHLIRVEYFEQYGDQGLRVEVEGPDTPRGPAEFLLTASPELAQSEPDHFVADAALAEQGRQLFVATGCSACHSMRTIADAGEPKPSAGALNALNARAGCLAESPAANAPRYALSARQRECIGAALAESRDGAIETSPQQQIEHAMTALNCYACHQRGDRGGVERARNEFFLSDQQEMGDEGRIPPHLTGAGDKLRSEWLRHVFEDGARERPYMLTRMPRFGLPNIGHLVAALQQVDKPTAAPPPHSDAPVRRLKEAGRFLAGEQGFACIKCHTFADSRATGIQAISLTSLTRRLNADWFLRYMLDPQAFRPGTRMPAAWPRGQVLLPGVLNGKADTQIHAVWTYLSDGESAAPPIGLAQFRIELAAEDEAIVYRNFIEGAGTRAIGVAYPEKVNLAFDANEMRIALLWQGAFIDASRHWSGRGQGFQPPLGNNVLRLPGGVPLAVLNDADASWPAAPARELGYSFRGYRLKENRRPVFLYEYRHLRVEDDAEPVAGEENATLRRTIRLHSDKPAEKLWLRAAAGGEIQSTGPAEYMVNRDWRVKVVQSPGGAALVRSAGGNFELLVPADLPEGRGELVLEYSW